jgi:hypothetical protein
MSKLSHKLAVGAATMAVTAAPAAAMPQLPYPPASSDGLQAPIAVPAGAPQSAAGGFDFGDAAIGAGTLLALLAVGGSGTLVVRRMRAPSRVEVS